MGTIKTRPAESSSLLASFLLIVGVLTGGVEVNNDTLSVIAIGIVGGLPAVVTYVVELVRKAKG
jgi:hypothetical protein